MVMEFPADVTPGGNVWLSHHFVYAAWGALFVAWLIARDGEKPWAVVGGLLVALFGWYHMWPTGKPYLGTTVVMVGLLVASAGVTVNDIWEAEEVQRFRLVVGVLLVVAWDDIFEHAFGVWTPLDWLWTTYILQFMP